MRLTNDFRSGLPVDELWSTITDHHQLCELLSGVDVQGDGPGPYQGRISVPVGNDRMTYDSTATVVVLDPSDRLCVLDIEGIQVEGDGGFRATLTIRGSQAGSESEVYLEADMDVTGSLVRRGRGAVGDVVNHLVRDLEDNLRAKALAAGALGPASAGRSEAAEMSPERKPPAHTAMWVLPVAGAVSLLVLAWRWISRRSSQ